jgi:chemotaxis regulatin CheY-phosphate phosphatase CheZ
MAAKKTPPKNSSASKPAARLATPRKPAAKPVTKAAARRPVRDTGAVLSELKSLAKELNKAAKGLTKKRSGNNPKDVSTVLGNVERMTAEAATKSLIEAESAKLIVGRLSDSLGRDWSRKDIEASLKELDGHLTNIIVAQEFQDLAGQSIRHALKALVGAIIVTEGGGPTEEGRLSQTEVDSLLKDLMP